MLHTMFYDNRPTGSGEEDFLRVFTIYEHGGHFGHVTRLIQICFHFLVPQSLHMKFVYKWPSGFREKQVLIL